MDWAWFRIAARLEQVRNAIGQPMPVNSGFRSPIHNSFVSVAKNSPHLYGYAADISPIYDYDGDGLRYGFNTSDPDEREEDWQVLADEANSQGACVEPSTPQWTDYKWVHMDWRAVYMEADGYDHPCIW